MPRTSLKHQEDIRPVHDKWNIQNSNCLRFGRLQCASLINGEVAVHSIKGHGYLLANCKSDDFFLIGSDEMLWVQIPFGQTYLNEESSHIYMHYVHANTCTAHLNQFG